MSRVKIALAGSLVLIALLGVSNFWLFTQVNYSQTQSNAKNNQIQTLQNQADYLSDRIAELEIEGQSKLNQINALNESYTGLQSQYEDLQDQVVQRDHQIQTLQNEVNSMSEQVTHKDNEIASLQQQFIDLNQSYMELLEKYEDLFFHYNLLNRPASNFTTINDLNITLAVNHTTYYYKDPVSGNVTITYLNGTEFRGAFILYIRHLTDELMSTTAEIAIDGFTDFYLSSPVFRFGPGNYTIGISSLSTADGYIIESRWRAFPSVQVEAK